VNPLAYLKQANLFDHQRKIHKKLSASSIHNYISLEMVCVWGMHIIWGQFQRSEHWLGLSGKREVLRCERNTDNRINHRKIRLREERGQAAHLGRWPQPKLIRLESLASFPWNKGSMLLLSTNRIAIWMGHSSCYRPSLLFGRRVGAGWAQLICHPKITEAVRSIRCASVANSLRNASHQLSAADDERRRCKFLSSRIHFGGKSD
jgi:hypothetical protein